jgi:hypothetical protein
MIGPTDLLHPFPAPHLKNDAKLKKKSLSGGGFTAMGNIPFHSEGTDFPQK